MKAIRVRIPLVCGRLCSVESDNVFSIAISDRIYQSAVTYVNGIKTSYVLKYHKHSPSDSVGHQKT